MQKVPKKFLRWSYRKNDGGDGGVEWNLGGEWGSLRERSACAVFERKWKRKSGEDPMLTSQEGERVRWYVW